MRILGVDPGTARVGWGIVEKGKPIAYGLIATSQLDTLEHRLVSIYEEFTGIIHKFTPTVVSIEDLFFSKNTKTALSVGQARGVLLLAASQCNLPVFSYNPLTVKKTICGSGAASKEQVTKMVVQLLTIKTIPKPDDVVDALAIALTHDYSYKLKQALS